MRRPAALLLLLSLAAGCCDLSIESDTLPAATTGQAYSFSLESDCGGDVWFVSEGVLPPGIAFTSEGDFSGIPSAAGTFVFTVGLEDFSGHTVFKGFSLTVTEPLL